MKLFLILTFTLPALQSSPVQAESPAHWYCKEVGSEKKGSQIYSCGVGTGNDENEARTAAFENAKTEFFRVCSLSADCKGHLVKVSPERTSCEPDPKGTKCYRLLVFTIGPKDEAAPALMKTDASATVALPPAKKITKSTKSDENYEEPEKIQDHSIREVFKPFVYSQIESNPKVHVGMPKADLLRQFGAPVYINQSGSENYFYYRGEMCIYRFQNCYAQIRDGRVVRFDDFKPIYTDLLK